MFFLEVMLTIIAWFRGWKWKSLFPLAIVITLSLVAGIGAGASGGDVENLAWLGILDFIALGALAAMCFVQPKV